MSVHQLKDGRWIVRHRIGADPERPTANKKYFGRGLEAARDANEWNAMVLAAGSKITTPNAGTCPSFINLVNEYLLARKNTMTATSWQICVDKMKQTILPEFADSFAYQLTPARLDQYATSRAECGVKRTTIHRELDDIRAVLRWSVKRRLLSSNPMEGFEMPTRDDARIQPPTHAEFAAILTTASPHLQRAMLITYHTGLRPGKEELLCLKWDAVDFYGKTLMVISAKKGGLPSRMVPLNRTILAHLEEWHSKDLKMDYPGYIVHYHGQKIACLKTAWKAAKKRAKVLRRLRMYDIRHACATNMLALGADLKSVSEILGHTSPEMTMRVYQHVDNKLKRAAADLLVGATDVLETQL
jgi:integrase